RAARRRGRRGRARHLRDPRGGRAAQPCRGPARRRTRARRRGRDPHQGQPAHRRADVGGGGLGLGPAHQAPRQPLLRDPDAALPAAVPGHRCRGQPRARPAAEGGHRAERDRPCAGAGHRRAQGRDPGRGGNGEPVDAGHPRRRRPVQDGRPRPDHRRRARRPAGLRQRGIDGRGQDQGHRLAGGRAGRHPGGARPGKRPPAGQAADLHGPGRQRRDRARRARAGGAHQPRLPARVAHGLVRDRTDAGPPLPAEPAVSAAAPAAMPAAPAVASSGANLVVVLNCGSSSIKFAVYDGGVDPLPRRALWNGKVQGIGGPAPDFGETGVAPFAITLDAAEPYTGALALLRDRVLARLAPRRVGVVAHRLVRGGSRYFDPVRVVAAVLDDLRGYVPLAPLLRPFAVEAIENQLREYPRMAQVACFVTGFHHTILKVEQILPLPYDAWQRGVRRYGFHGLSYAYMATALPERDGDAARGRTIVAHLGSGASLCAMQGLESVATTMGFSALDGLETGTRTGAHDPGAVLYMMEVEMLGLEEVGRVLYHRSGLLGVSGISSEPRVIVRHEGDE